MYVNYKLYPIEEIRLEIATIKIRPEDRARRSAGLAGVADRSGAARTAVATFGAECKRDADGEDGQGGQQTGRRGAVDARPDNRKGVAGNEVRHAVVLTFHARCMGRI